jgi:enoyl-CoA hydratase/carnithine racemase
MEHIRTERDGAVGVITISRRERFNSLDVKTAQDLRKAGLGFARDESVRAVILRGEGGVFCRCRPLGIGEGGDGPISVTSSPRRGLPDASGKSSNRFGTSQHDLQIRRSDAFIAVVDGVAAAGVGLATA